MSIPGIVLNKILEDPSHALQYWAKLKANYFGSGYSRVYSAIARYYAKYNTLPSFSELEIYSSRDKGTISLLEATKGLKIPEDVDLSVLVESLLDKYIQNETLEYIHKLVERITIMDSHEIKENISDILMQLEEKTHNSEHVFSMTDITVIDHEELQSKVYLNINNTFDHFTGGVSLTELIMVGGHRGSGKSIVSVNVGLNQYLQGNVGVIFSIEMRAREVFERTISALAGVPFTKLRKGSLTEFELNKVAEARSEMFLDGEKYYEMYKEHRDFVRFERELLSEGTLLPDNQIVIVDNQMLSLADIDLNLQKLKAQFKDKLKVVVVDYVNQIAIQDMYNWQSQVELAKGLKNLARKYEIVMVAPYQIDKTGEARFAKGLLDPADIALTISAKDNAIEFDTTKARNIPSTKFASEMNWETLRLSSTDAQVIEKEEEPKKKKEAKRSEEELPF